MKQMQGEVAAARTAATQNRPTAATAILAGLALLATVSVPGVSQAASQEPEMSPEAQRVDHTEGVFKPDPTYEDKPYSPEDQFVIYGAKRDAATPRPLLELGRPIYREGPFQPGINVIGRRNLLFPALTVFGDWQTAIEYNDNGNDERGHIATTLNLDIDLKLTGTERFHMFVQPLERNGQVTRHEFFGRDRDGFDRNTNANIQTLFFEGDLGAIMTGLLDEEQGFDLPFAVGLTPIFFQNGIWVDDAFIGGGFAIPAKNSPMLDISNMDVTFYAGFKDVENPGILDADGQRNDEDLSVYGVNAFIEAHEGYYELGAGMLYGRNQLSDQTVYGLTAAFTKRYGGWLSNSVRGFWFFGQNRDNNQRQTVDGVALLVENSLITHLPSTLVPYANFFIGLDRPQPLSSQTGLLTNTGINFESGGLQGYPRLDDSANDTFGGAIGIQYLFDLEQQIVVEAATVQTIGGFKAEGRNAKNDQYALGLRWQLPISPAWILRADAMYGLLVNDDNIKGARLEIRRKF